MSGIYILWREGKIVGFSDEDRVDLDVADFDACAVGPIPLELVAAAQGLLETCEAMLPFLRDTPPIAERARAEIAKAKGEQT